MTLLTKKAFTQLSGVHAPTCISIFIPTHRAGQEVLEKKDQLALKNQLKEVSHNLAGQGYSDQEVKSMLEPAAQLLEDTEFWRHQSDGLALFISEGFFQKFTFFLKNYPYFSKILFLQKKTLLYLISSIKKGKFTLNK